MLMCPAIAAATYRVSSLPGVDDHTDHHQIALANGTDSTSNHASSLFMHRSAGAAVLSVGSLTVVARLTPARGPAIRVGIGGIWIVLGLFLFV